MTQIKQRTIEDAMGDSVTFTLHKLDNPIREVRNTPFLYEVRINGTTDEEVFTKDAAEATFEQVIRQHQRGAELDARDHRRPASHPLDAMEHATDSIFRGGGLF